MGEAGSNETVISVTGLKPGHYYNVRVIAVGSNNYQTPSRTVRLNTYGADSRPDLGTAGRLPASFNPDEAEPPARDRDHAEENGGHNMPYVETAALVQDVQNNPVREPPAAQAAASGAGARRNTVGRKHSQSIGSASQEQHQQHVGSDTPTTDGGHEESVAELQRRFDKIRAEIAAVDEEREREKVESRRLIDGLVEQRQEKRKEQQEKEKTTAELKRDVGTSERAARAALNKKTQKEKTLREREAERSRFIERSNSWRREEEKLRKEREEYDAQRAEIAAAHEKDKTSMAEYNSSVAKNIADMEAELKERSARVHELTEARKRLPGNEEDKAQAQEHLQRVRAWEQRENGHRNTIRALERKMREINHRAKEFMEQHFFIQGGETPAELDFANAGQVKRRSRFSGSMSSVMAGPSPMAQYNASGDSPYSHGGAYPTASTSAAAGHMPVFVPGNRPLLFDPESSSRLIDDGGRKMSLTAGAPLSPNAASLLPSGILGEDEPPSPTSRTAYLNDMLATGGPWTDVAGAAAATAAAAEAQSPTSSSRSISMLSSPRSSSQNLPFPSQYPGVDGGAAGDRRSLPGLRGDYTVPASAAGGSGAVGASTGASSSRIGSIFSATFHRNRAAKPPTMSSALDQGGPLLGTLKPGQSRSFPRQTDESGGESSSTAYGTTPVGGGPGSRRRISFSSGLNMFNRNSLPAGVVETSSTFPTISRPFAGSSSRRMIHHLGAAGGSSGALVVSDRDPSSPRPASLASSDMPRPSTDSGSFWGIGGPPPGHNPRPWGPGDTGFWPSRSASRRASVHDSPSALETSLATADDKVLYDKDLADPHVSPSQVGVIGSKPPKKGANSKAGGSGAGGSTNSSSQRLNPAAKVFSFGSLFEKKPDKDKESSAAGDATSTAKSKDKSRARDREKKSKRGCGSTGPTSNPETPGHASTHPPPTSSSSLTADDYSSPPTSEGHRKSRDALSVHTQTSTVSESRESLSLDLVHTLSMSSNTPSLDYPTAAAPPASSVAARDVKESETALKKLFRKGSSSKFSLSRGTSGSAAGGTSASTATSTPEGSLPKSLSGGGGLFKKGPASIASSTGNASAVAIQGSGGVERTSFQADSHEDHHSTSAGLEGSMHSADGSISGGNLPLVTPNSGTAAGSPSLGPISGSATSSPNPGKDGSRWGRFSMKKKGKSGAAAAQAQVAGSVDGSEVDGEGAGVLSK